MFSNNTQTPLKIVNMEFYPTLNKKLFSDEPTSFQIIKCKIKWGFKIIIEICFQILAFAGIIYVCAK